MTHITDTQIRTLRAEAFRADDLATAHLCDVALGLEAPLMEGESFEARYGGGGGLTDEDQSDVMAATSPEVALRMCAEAIAEARD